MNVTLKSKVGAITLTTDFGKEVKFDFNEKNGFMCELPTEVIYKDVWGKEHKAHDNYAQHILNDVRDSKGEPVFEIAEIKETPVVTAPAKRKSKEKTQ